MHLSGELNNDPVIPILPLVLKMFLSTIALYLYSVFVKEDYPALANQADGIWHAFQCHPQAFCNKFTQGSSHILEESDFVWFIIYYLIKA